MESVPRSFTEVPMQMRAFALGVGLAVSSGAAPLRAQAVEVRPFVAPDGQRFDEFGFALTFSDDRMLIGAWDDEDQGEAAGSTYVFERDASGDWVQVAKLLASDGEELYYFGISVALEGDFALIGANRADDPIDFSGAVYVFERSSAGEWVETQKLETGRPGEAFGTAVVLQGDRAFISAPGRQGLSGRAFVYERDALGHWSQTAMFEASDNHELDFFGMSLAAVGDRVLVGAFGNSFNRGAAY